MAYKGYSFKYDGTRNKMWAYIQVVMEEFGWTLHDDISSTVKVYKSNGESGKEPYGYVWIDGGTSTYIQFDFYQFWDAVNHVGVRRQIGAGTTVNRLGQFSSTGEAILAGDKDIVILCANENAYQGLIFGHLPIRFNTSLAYAMGTAGTVGTLRVSGTSGFYAGEYLQIVGAGTEGCEQTQIQSVADSETIVVTKLSRDYGTGAVIGFPASSFGYVPVNSSVYSRWYQTSHYNDAGTTVSSQYLTITSLALLCSNVHHFSQKYSARMSYIASDLATEPGVMLGMFGTNFVSPAMVATWDIAGWNTSGEYGTAGTATTGGSSLLIETGKAWTTDIHANRFVVIQSGTGAAQMKKITGNDATSLTLQGTFGTAFGTSRYKIYDHVWRATTYMFTSVNGIRITDTIAPTLPE